MSRKQKSLWRQIRWLAVAPVAVAGFYIALMVGLLLYGLVERLCPPEDIISGSCQTPWILRLEDSLFYVGAGLAGFLVVSLAALTAPSHKFAVALLSFIAGTLFAGFLALTGTLWAEAFTAILAGALAILLVYARTKKASPKSHDEQQTSASSNR